MIKFSKTCHIPCLQKAHNTLVPLSTQRMYMEVVTLLTKSVMYRNLEPDSSFGEITREGGNGGTDVLRHGLWVLDEGLPYFVPLQGEGVVRPSDGAIGVQNMKGYKGNMSFY